MALACPNFGPAGAKSNRDLLCCLFRRPPASLTLTWL